ncbi:MAG: YicC/YloC family endoribonuclease [Pseudomonadota bacterium]
MLESMTAFGSIDVECGNLKTTIEIRSVNHRFFECRMKAPSHIYKIENSVRNLLKEKLKRGSIDFFVKPCKSVSEDSSATETLEVDNGLLLQYIKTLASVKKKFKIKDELKLSDIIRLPNIFRSKDDEITSDFLEKHLLPSVAKCADSILEMQKKEGQALKTAIDKNINEIEKNIDVIGKNSVSHFEETYKKVSDRITSLLSNHEISKDRIAAEAGIIADRLDISEELDRLKSHIEQFRQTEKGNTEPIGKKLDFIIQEINREFNTIASKSENKDIVYTAVESKTLVEKIREQIQNVK